MSDTPPDTDYRAEALIALTLLVTDLYEVVSGIPGVDLDKLRSRLATCRTQAQRYGVFAVEIVDYAIDAVPPAPKEPGRE